MKRKVVRCNNCGTIWNAINSNSDEQTNASTNNNVQIKQIETTRFYICPICGKYNELPDIDTMVLRAEKRASAPVKGKKFNGKPQRIKEI